MEGLSTQMCDVLILLGAEDSGLSTLSARLSSFPIHVYDVVMLAVLVLTTLFGLWKGMAWQLASLGSLVLSFVVALRCSRPLAGYISDNEPWNRFIAILILYLATSLVIWLLFRLVAGAIDRVHLKEFDRQMGALFGLLKGAALCLVITFFAVTLSERSRQAVLKSQSGTYIAVFIQKATPTMPEEIREVLGKYIKELDQKLKPTTLPEPTPTEHAETEQPLETQPIAGLPLGEKIKAEIEQKFLSKVDQRLDQGTSRLDEKLGTLENSVNKRLDEGVARLGNGFNALTGTLEQGMDRAFDGLPTINLDRPLVEPPGLSTMGALPGYQVKRGEVLTITSSGRQAMFISGGGSAPNRTSIDGLYRVGADGSIDLGRYGTVPAAGKRLGDVERLIEQKLSLAASELSLGVAAPESQVVYVVVSGTGQWDNLWRVPTGGARTVEDAVRLAGVAAAPIEKIWITHPSPGGRGTGQLLLVQWDSAGRSATPNYSLSPGDGVFISGHQLPEAADVAGWITAAFEKLKR